MVPVRTCLGCRSREATTALLRVTARNGAVIPDPRGSLGGRGAWVHPTVQCVGLAVRRKALTRALRLTSAPDTSALDTITAARGVAGASDIQSFEEQAD